MRRERPHDLARAALAVLALAAALTVPMSLKAATVSSAGATFNVNSTADAGDANLGNPACATSTGLCTLRAAVQQANALAGPDVIRVPAGTYALAIRPLNQNLADTGDLDITGPLTIVGAGAGETVVDGGVPTTTAPEIRGLDRLFEIHAGAGDVKLESLTIQEGYSSEQGGALYTESTGVLTLENVRVLDSYAAKHGGGIANAAGGRVELVGSIVSGNGAKEGGTAIHNAVAGTVSITQGSAIVDNPGNGPSSGLDEYPITGGAINNDGAGDTIGTIEILDSTVAGNEASSNGGGIRNDGDGVIVVRRSTIRDNATTSSGAGIYSTSGRVLISESVISGNVAGNLISSGDGGGVYNAGQLSKAGTPGRLEITGSTITGNRANADGGGIVSGLDADLIITDTEISHNHAGDEGGGISSQVKADMTLTRVQFLGNTAAKAGGGAYAYAEGASTITDTIFEGNEAGETGGGGLYTDGSGTIVIRHTTFENNRAVGDGGGVVVSSSGQQSIEDSVVRGNHTDEGGGGVFNSGLGVRLERLTITDNTALLDGGGIKSEGSSQLVVSDVTVENNTAENGGGFANAADGTLLLVSSTLSGNEARGEGGGLLNISDASSEVLNTTLSGNTAGDRGGGLYTNADAELNVFNTTITNNTASAGSGLSTSVESINFPVIPATRVVLRNTIVAANHDGTNCHGAVFSEGGNLDEGTTCFFSDPSDLARAGASLEPLASNGGLTKTHSPKATSVAIDRGVEPCPQVDQRGVTRPRNVRCDIGAVEFEGTPGTPDSNPLPPPTGPDTTPPIVSLDAKPMIRTLDIFAEFKFRADELATFECVLNPATGASFSGCESPHDYPVLQLGLNTFQVRAIDAARNVGQPITYTWRIVEELDPPETSIGEKPPSTTRLTTARFGFSADEAVQGFECSLDGAAFAACPTPLVLTGLGEGPHKLEVIAIDNSFNPDETPAAHSWTVDLTPPDTEISGGPTGATKNASPAFTLLSSEAGATTFECRLSEAAPFAPCSASFSPGPLADGAYKLEARASDAAGNTDLSPASRIFTVDTLAPGTAIDGDPKALVNDATPEFSFSSDEADASFECRVDLGEFAPCTSPHTTAALDDGAHTFQVRATDPAGNTDGSPASHDFTVDTQAPTVTLGARPSAVTKQTSAAIYFSSEANASFECKLDAGVFAGCSSLFEASALGEGPHTFVVRASDEAGNLSAQVEYSWTIDTTAPLVTDLAGPSGLTKLNSGTFTFSSNEAGVSFACAVDSLLLVPCTSGHPTGELDDGAHFFLVQATDVAGNKGPVDSRSWTIDTLAPGTTIDGDPKALVNDASPQFSFSSDEAGASFECRVDLGEFASCTSPHTTAALDDGAHTFQVRATDPAGNTDGSPASHDFTVDTIGPLVTDLTGPSGLTTLKSGTFTFSSDEAGASFACALDSEVFSPCTSGYRTGELGDGAHTFSVRATDLAGNEGEPVSRIWTIDTTAPTVTITGGPEGPTGNPAPTFTFSGEEGATFECRIGGDFASCSGPYAPTVNLGQGPHTFQVRATDAAGNISEPVGRSFTVDTNNPQTTIDPNTGPSGTTTSTSAAFGFSADEAVKRFECRLDAAPEFTPCVSGTSYGPLALGEHTFRVRAVDLADNVGLPTTRTWTIVAPDTTSPQTTIDPNTGPSGTTASTSAAFGFSADEAVKRFECRLDAAPEFTPCVSGTSYGPLALGEHTFRVRAVDLADNVGLPATRTWTIVAQDTTPPDTAIGSGPNGPTNDNTPTFAFSAIGEPAQRFECRLGPAPFETCASPFTLPALADAAYTFDVRAVDPAGNADESPANRSFSIDTVLPVATIGNPRPANPTTQTNATFNFSANETGARLECSLDAGAFIECMSTISYPGLGTGDHTFRIRAIDAANNMSAVASYTWRIDAPPPSDTTPPTITTLTGPANGTHETTATFSFAANEQVTFRCRLDQGAWADCSSGTATYNGLQPGPRSFQVEAKDNAQLTSTRTHAWTIVAPGGCTNPGTVTLGAAADSWILQSSATSNYGGDSAMKVDTKNGSNARVLVRFALPTIPQGCAVTSVKLRLYAVSYKDGRTLEAHALSSSWSENDVTWANQSSAATGSAVTTQSGSGYREWTVTSLYGQAGNGFLIRDASENGNGVEQGFHSREKGNDNPPQLVVTFG